MKPLHKDIQRCIDQFRLNQAQIYVESICLEPVQDETELDWLSMDPEADSALNLEHTIKLIQKGDRRSLRGKK